MDKQNIIDHIKDLLERGEISSEEANVELVLAERYRLITSRIPREVRKALNNAVKQKKLGHLKKDHLKPEVYYHPNFKYLAIDARNKHERESLKALEQMFVIRKDN